MTEYPQVQIVNIIIHSNDGGIVYRSAAIECPRCEEKWKGLKCPWGCGVEVIDTNKEDAEKWRQKMAKEEVERKREREEFRQSLKMNIRRDD